MQKIIIIGGGPAGYSSAIRAAQLGNEVVLIEKTALGGTCLNVGCIPTKALLHASSLYAQAKSSNYIKGATELEADLTKIYQHSNGIIQKFNGGVQALINANKISYYNSRGTLLNNRQVKLENGEIIEGDKIILATGARTAIPPITGIELSLTSDDIIKQNFQTHKTVTIIGAGVIGMEFATFFSDLGSKVTVIDILDNVLNNMSSDISKYISLSMRRKKVKLLLGAKVLSLKSTDDGIVTEYQTKNCTQTITSDIVISSVGRVANSIEGIEHTSILFDKGFIVDENNRTAEENIYAVGDCAKGSIQLAHYASADGIRVAEHLSNQPTKALSNIPSCAYTSPNAAIVGKSQEECNFEIEIGRFNMGANGKTLAEGGNLGYIKVIFDKASTQLIGAEMVCHNACELIGFIANMINIGLTRQDILSSIYPHPSISEGFFEAVEDSRQRSIHTVYKDCKLG